MVRLVPFPTLEDTTVGHVMRAVLAGLDTTRGYSLQEAIEIARAIDVCMGISDRNARSVSVFVHFIDSLSLNFMSVFTLDQLDVQITEWYKEQDCMNIILYPQRCGFERLRAFNNTWEVN